MPWGFQNFLVYISYNTWILLSADLVLLSIVRQNAGLRGKARMKGASSRFWVKNVSNAV